MSERISWETCPRCGSPAALGWAPSAASARRSDGEELPVEFDCTAGCTLNAAELRTLADRRQ